MRDSGGTSARVNAFRFPAERQGGERAEDFGHHHVFETLDAVGAQLARDALRHVREFREIHQLENLVQTDPGPLPSRESMNAFGLGCFLLRSA